MARRVICGIDSDDRAAGVVVLAASLSRALDAELVVVHCVNPSTLPPGRGREGGRIRRLLTVRGRQLINRSLTEAGCEERGRGVVQVCDPVEELLALAAGPDTEALVVGSRGRGRLQGALLGSVSRRLAAEAPCPVAVLPREADGQWTPARVLAKRGKPTLVCGVDGSPAAGVAIGSAATLARSTRGSLLLAHVRERSAGAAEGPVVRSIDYGELLDSERRARLKLLHRSLDTLGRGADAEVRLVDGHAASALDQLAREEAADMIVTGSRGRGRFKAAVLGSTSMELACSATRPVLICPRGARALDGGRGDAYRSAPAEAVGAAR